MNKLDKVFRINPLYESDGYKIGHNAMLALGTVREYWTWIPRSLKYMPPSIKKIMSSHQQMVWRYIHSNFKELFFDQPIECAEKFGKDMALYLMQPYEASQILKMSRHTINSMINEPLKLKKNKMKNFIFKIEKYGYS